LPSGIDDESGRRSTGASRSDSFLLTAAERRKIEARDSKREAEECFSFLKDIRDAEGRRPTDPDYDKRTIYIPKSAWKTFTPFEEQFWEIKQNHYDTVLFFQKGKFYELYEDDALIGHQEFDLKLTDRVKMKMVNAIGMKLGSGSWSCRSVCPSRASSTGRPSSSRRVIR
jgi:DNA mismatch repair protein MSH6